MKPLVIYHADCVDGFGAAFAAWLTLGDNVDYVPCKYGKQSDEFDLTQCEGREVYILDFSFKRETMDLIFFNSKRTVWLDHHKSALEMWLPETPFKNGNKHLDCDYPEERYIILDDNKSGAMISWEYFNPGQEVPSIFQHIDDYDRWQFKLDGTKEFIKALWSNSPWSFKQWFRILTSQETQREMYITGRAILKAHDQNVQSVVKASARNCRILTTKPKEDGEHWEADIIVNEKGLAANCPPHLASDVGHELATQSGTFGLLWYVTKTGEISCSLRSNGDYDVSAIAKAFGGGGHKNAAGFICPNMSTLMSWIK